MEPVTLTRSEMDLNRHAQKHEQQEQTDTQHHENAWPGQDANVFQNWDLKPREV